MICAAPSFLDRYGRPQHPNELLDAPVVMAATSVLLTDWQFITPEGPLTLRPPSRFVVSSNNAALHAARLGGGFTRVLSYQAAEAAARGELEIVLADFSTAPLPIHLLYQDGARLPAKVRSFVSHCAERLRADPTCKLPSREPLPGNAGIRRRGALR